MNATKCRASSMKPRGVESAFSRLPRTLPQALLLIPSRVTFRCKSCAEKRVCGSAVTIAAARPLQDPEAVAEYVNQQPILRDQLALTNNDRSATKDSGAEVDRSEDAAVDVRELSGGKINFVWLVSGPTGLQLVLKYAAPFVRSIGPEFQLSQARLRVEAEAMAAAHAACPRHVPALLLYDSTANVLVQELVTGPAGRRRVKLVTALAPRAKRGGHDRATGSSGGSSNIASATPAALADEPPPPRLAADLASMLDYLFRNSVYVLPYERHRAAAEALRNREVVAANAAVVFTDPWDGACPRNRVPPALAEHVSHLRADEAVRTEVARLLDLYLNSSETLIHNDLTAGNILVPEPEVALDATGSPQVGELTPGCTTAPRRSGSDDCLPSEAHLIDWEFATYGPMSYDIGSLVGNLLLSYCATCGGSGAADAAVAGGEGPLAIRSPADPLLQCIVELWDGLELRMRSYSAVPRADAASGGDAATAAAGSPGLGDDAFVQRVLSDSLGYAGCVMARLSFGMHHCPSLEAIACERRRAARQRLALRLAASMLRPRERTARGWDRVGVVAFGDSSIGRRSAAGGGGTAAEAGTSGGGGGLWRLAVDAQNWAAEARAEEAAAAEEAGRSGAQGV